MDSNVGDRLKDALVLAQWDSAELWLAAFALGGNLSSIDIDRIASGQREASAIEYDVLAAALNDHFSDMGIDTPVPYSRELPAA